MEISTGRRYWGERTTAGFCRTRAAVRCSRLPGWCFHDALQLLLSKRLHGRLSSFSACGSAGWELLRSDLLRRRLRRGNGLPDQFGRNVRDDLQFLLARRVHGRRRAVRDTYRGPGRRTLWDDDVWRDWFLHSHWRQYPVFTKRWHGFQNHARRRDHDTLQLLLPGGLRGRLQSRRGLGAYR